MLILRPQAVKTQKYRSCNRLPAGSNLRDNLDDAAVTTREKRLGLGGDQARTGRQQPGNSQQLPAFTDNRWATSRQQAT